MPIRLTVRLPLPSPSRKDDNLANFDEQDWPGGSRKGCFLGCPAGMR